MIIKAFYIGSLAYQHRARIKLSSGKEVLVREVGAGTVFFQVFFMFVVRRITAMLFTIPRADPVGGWPHP